MKIEGNELIISGVVATIDRDNIDTDQIIPTEYLKSIKKFGFEDYLFDGWRYLDEGKLGISKNDREQNPDFILNQAPYDKATILLTSCLLYTSPSPRDRTRSRMPSSA